MFDSKKRLAPFLLACAIFFANLGSCRISIKEKKAETTEPETAEPETEAAAVSHEIEEAEAMRLVSEDMQMIEFLINLKIDGKQVSIGEGGMPWYMPADSLEYSNFRDLMDRLDSIYVSAEAYSPFFRYPMFGYPQIENFGDDIYVYPHYLTNFEARIDSGSIEISEFSEGAATFEFEILNHEFFGDGAMSMTRTEEGWRLDESFFFYCQKRLDLLDIENSIEWEDNPVLDGAQNFGSAKRLAGDCMFYNIFINDRESYWDPESVADLYSMQNEAFRYLEAQAALFGHDLRCFATDESDAVYIYLDAYAHDDSDYHYWLDIFFMDTEYGSVNGLLEALSADGHYDNCGLIVNVNKNGRSYAVSCNDFYDDHREYYAERAVIYHTTDMDYEYATCPAMIAHEILHIFGATDLYYPNDEEDIRKQIVMQYFPFEIMHYVPFDIDEATISIFTAFRVGWRNTLPDQLMMFQANG